MDQQMDLSSSKHSLFQAHRSYGNVVLIFQHAADHELGYYARAFHKAGQALTEQMFARASYNDLEACPIVFLYRHALELYLKATALIGDEIVQLNGGAPTNRKRLFTTHRLLPLLPLLKQTFEAVGWTWELEINGLRTYEEVEDLLRDFETVDPNSYTFRYPVDTEGHPSVPHHFMLHIPTFCKHMDALLESLEAAVMGLEVTKDEMIEAAYRAQNDDNRLNDPWMTEMYEE